MYVKKKCLYTMSRGTCLIFVIMVGKLLDLPLYFYESIGYVEILEKFILLFRIIGPT